MSTRGWYDDGHGAQRWFDGTQWTDRTQQPYAPDVVGTAPAGTNPYSWHVWVLLALFVVQMVPSFFINWNEYLTFSLNPTDTSALSGFIVPYVLTFVISWGSTAAALVVGYLDYKALLARGVPKPFHWAFGFLGTVVYIIGRSVIARRRTGSGIAPMWIAIVTYVVFCVALFTVIIAATIGFVTDMSDLYGR